MAHRLLPFRQYDENDVVNLYAMRTDGLNLNDTKPNVDGKNADGVLVKVEQGDFNKDTVSVTENSNMQGSFSSPVGRNPYPTNPLKLTAASTGDAVLGVTLRQTLNIDENNEQLLYNPVKKDELNAVLSGQTVPVLTRGIIAVTSDAVDASASDSLAIGDKLSANDGKFSEAKADDKDFAVIGTVIGTGSRGSNKDNNYGGIADDQYSGNYYVIKLDC